MTQQQQDRGFTNVALTRQELAEIDLQIAPALAAVRDMFPMDGMWRGGRKGQTVKVNEYAISRREIKNQLRTAAAVLNALSEKVSKIADEINLNSPRGRDAYKHHYEHFVLIAQSTRFKRPSFHSLTTQVTTKKAANEIVTHFHDTLWLVWCIDLVIDFDNLACPKGSYMEVLMQVRPEFKLRMIIPPPFEDGDRINMMMALTKMLERAPTRDEYERANAPLEKKRPLDDVVEKSH